MQYLFSQKIVGSSLLLKCEPKDQNILIEHSMLIPGQAYNLGLSCLTRIKCDWYNLDDPCGPIRFQPVRAYVKCIVQEQQ